MGRGRTILGTMGRGRTLLLLFLSLIISTVPTSSSWVLNSGIDCYANSGGDPIQPDPYSNNLSLEQCKTACQQDSQCEGIIRKASDGQGSGICYKRKNIQLVRCVHDRSWNLYKKQAGSVVSDGWDRRPNVDCYAGRGGDPIQPDPYSNSLSLRDCKAACTSDYYCQGIIRKSSDGEGRGICYKRKNLVLSNCVTDYQWELHRKPTTGGSPVTTTRRTTLRPSTSYGCKYGIQGYPNNLPNSYYYSQLCTTHNNLKVISANRASGAALERTAFLIGNVMANVDPRVAQSMNARGFRHAVMGAYPSELTTHIPEHAWLGAYWNERARGLGATVATPVGSSAEENALCHSNDRYRVEDITIHEFAHSMHLLGFALVFPTFNSELTGLYNAARAANIWGSGHYAMTDFKEYFAEGVQSYYGCNAPDHYAPTNRDQLRRRDPNFYHFLDRYLGYNTWQRTC